MASLILAACGGFLLAVLWMDLMFDVQVLRYREGANLPEPVLASIAAYYHRVTTSARPMGHLVGAVMAIALVTLAVELAAGGRASWIPLASLVVVGPIALAALRVVPNAVRLAARSDSAEQQSALARAICRDHLVCLAGVLVFEALQLFAAPCPWPR
jgi:hypothetical protein